MDRICRRRAPLLTMTDGDEAPLHPGDVPSRPSTEGGEVIQPPGNANNHRDESEEPRSKQHSHSLIATLVYCDVHNANHPYYTRSVRTTAVNNVPQTCGGIRRGAPRFVTALPAATLLAGAPHILTVPEPGLLPLIHPRCTSRRLAAQLARAQALASAGVDKGLCSSRAEPRTVLPPFSTGCARTGVWTKEKGQQEIVFSKPKVDARRVKLIDLSDYPKED